MNPKAVILVADGSASSGMMNASILSRANAPDPIDT